MFPESFEKTAKLLEVLPGVGAKTAQRYVFTLMKMSDEERNTLADALRGLNDLHACSTCGFLTAEEKCQFCSSKDRDSSRIMVVSYDQDAVAVERTDSYHGLYHILKGVISSTKGIYPEDLNLDSLFKRLDGVKEVIVATPFTVEGEMTAMYLDRVLKDKGVLVTRLAQGLPMGASLDYADDWTLTNALNNRKGMTND
ncbi:MAG: recombination mediator RecR [Erysipelotrichaceae bacterium]|nr:recombination mediator RecR [Erysipelotrichaceae bacterium]